MKKPLNFILICASLLMAGSAPAQTKAIKFPDINSLLEPSISAAKEKMEAASRSCQEELQKMTEDYSKKAGEYDSEKSNLSKSQREKMEKELQDLQSRIQEFQENASLKLEDKVKEQMLPIEQIKKELVLAQQKYLEVQTQYRDELTRMTNDYSKKVADYEVQKDKLAPVLREMKAKELAEFQSRIQSFRVAVIDDLDDLESKLAAPVYEMMLQSVLVPADNNELKKKK